MLDEDGTFEKRCNLTMVELESVPEEDVPPLYALMTNHAAYTGSTRAQMILDQWDVYRKKLVKIMPKEYRRALKEIAEQQRQQQLGEAA